LDKVFKADKNCQSLSDFLIPNEPHARVQVSVCSI